MMRNSKVGSQVTTNGQTKLNESERGELAGGIFFAKIDKQWTTFGSYRLSTDHNSEHAVGWRISANQACGWALTSGRS